MEPEIPTIRQVLRRHWLSFAIIAIGWAVAVFLVFPYLPKWLVSGVYSVLWFFFAYQLGVNTERRARIRDELERRAEIDRIREAMEELFRDIAQRDGKLKRASVDLERAAHALRKTEAN